MTSNITYNFITVYIVYFITIIAYAIFIADIDIANLSVHP